MAYGTRRFNAVFKGLSDNNDNNKNNNFKNKSVAYSYQRSHTGQLDFCN